MLHNTPQQLRNGWRLHDTAPASASASALTKGECNVEPYTPPTPTLTAADWDPLLAERTAIMHESGMPEGRARALALGDTIQTHGSRPQEAP